MLQIFAVGSLEGGSNFVCLFVLFLNSFGLRIFWIFDKIVLVAVGSLYANQNYHLSVIGKQKPSLA